MSLRARLTMSMLGTLAVAICAGLVGSYFVVRGQLFSEIDKSLRERAHGLAVFTNRAPPMPRPTPSSFRFPTPKFGAAAGYVQIVRAGRVELPAGESVRLPTNGATAVAAGRRTSFFRDASIAGTHVRIYTARVNSTTAIEI